MADAARRLVSGGTIALLALLLVTGTAAVTTAVLTAPRPDLLADADPLDEVPVSSYQYGDPRPVRVTLTTPEPLPLVAQASGTVTASWCTPGDEVASGGPLIAVDGATVVGLATATPLWRDLSAGLRGDDVQAVQDELDRLGFATSGSGRVDRSTTSALRSFAEAHGIALHRDGPLLRRSAVVWLPSSTARVESCEVVVGGDLAAGAEFATLAPPLVRAVAHTPSGLVPGTRVLAVDHVSVAVGADGVVDDPEALALLSTTPGYQAARATDEDALSGVLTLDEPLAVISVPVTAVFGEDAEGNACLIGDGAERQVQVIASELGQAIVTVSGDVPSTVTAVVGRRASCRSS
ncbi:peptidoglycan-binding protein [Cellulomonas sp. Y8]|uniref:peptidoglycan-binding domain-containing protein n=1 Tax=Cellulomonas sp. Y8 TaxID=2591145 RepID=UPI0011C8AAC6|nr:peptidoglycan-binding domain-containing protein [Cellulomonas sp. Y8]